MQRQKDQKRYPCGGEPADAGDNDGANLDSGKTPLDEQLWMVAYQHAYKGNNGLLRRVLLYKN